MRYSVLLTKIGLVFGALLLFDYVTSYYFIYDPAYWMGLVLSSIVIGVFFDRLPDM